MTFMRILFTIVAAFTQDKNEVEDVLVQYKVTLSS